MQHLPRMAAPGIVAVVKFLTTDGRSENTPGLNFAQDGGDRGHRDARSGVRRPPPRTWRLANAGDGRRRCRRRAIAGCLPAKDPGSDLLGRSQTSPLVPCGPDRLERRAQDIRLQGLQSSCRCARRKRRSSHRHPTFARTYAVVTQGTGGCPSHRWRTPARTRTTRSASRGDDPGSSSIAPVCRCRRGDGPAKSTQPDRSAHRRGPTPFSRPLPQAPAEQLAQPRLL